MARSSRTWIYAVLLAAQTAAAWFLLWLMFPIFLEFISAPGRRQDISLSTQALIIAGTSVLQCCYWLRYYRSDVYAPFRNATVGHLLLFASRVSFFFGGAFFSALFFRHIPELDGLPPLGQGLIQALATLAFLFSLFCYSLELERLGKTVIPRKELDPD